MPSVIIQQENALIIYLYLFFLFFIISGLSFLLSFWGVANPLPPPARSGSKLKPEHWDWESDRSSIESWTESSSWMVSWSREFWCRLECGWLACRIKIGVCGTYKQTTCIYSTIGFHQNFQGDRRAYWHTHTMENFKASSSSNYTTHYIIPLWNIIIENRRGKNCSCQYSHGNRHGQTKRITGRESTEWN